MSNSNFILIVEDNENHAEALKRTIERLIPNVTVFKRTGDFDNALDELLPRRPDVFIFDLYEGDYAPETLKGPELCKQVWSKRFRPLIVHSAFDADPHIDERLARHPFYKYISKKDVDCVDKVAAQVKEFLSHAAAVRQVEDEVHSVLQTVIQDTAETIWNAQNDVKLRSQALVRSARRRVGAMMDLKPLILDETLLSWEQYIVPPLEADLLMGDVLRAKNVAPTDATGYRIILTPSCDLVVHGGKAKVKSILAGRCVDAKAFFEAAKLRKADGFEGLRTQLSTILTQAQINGYCPLPGYPGFWPAMAIKLRETEFIQFEDVGPEEDKKFQRIASIDSPFREQIAWANMQIASRPALPDREIDSWVTSILESMGVKQVIHVSA